MFKCDENLLSKKKKLKNLNRYELSKEDGFVITTLLTMRRKKLERRRKIWHSRGKEYIDSCARTFESPLFTDLVVL